MTVKRTKPSESQLYHHGILGMKWGVRRYQNKDGSLTEAGKKRYLANLTKETLMEDTDLTEVNDSIKAYKEAGKDLLQVFSDNPDKERIDKAADTGLKALQEIGDYGIGETGNYYTEPEDVKESVKDWFVYEDQTFGKSEVADLANQGKTADEIEDIIEKVTLAKNNKEAAISNYINNFANTKLSNYTLSYEDKNRIEGLIGDYDKGLDNATFDLTEGYISRSYIDACIKVAAKNKSNTKS